MKALCRHRLYCRHFRFTSCLHLEDEVATQWPLQILIVQVKRSMGTAPYDSFIRDHWSSNFTLKMERVRTSEMLTINPTIYMVPSPRNRLNISTELQ